MLKHTQRPSVKGKRRSVVRETSSATLVDTPSELPESGSSSKSDASSFTYTHSKNREIRSVGSDKKRLSSNDAVLDNVDDITDRADSVEYPEQNPVFGAQKAKRGSLRESLLHVWPKARKHKPNELCGSSGTASALDNSGTASSDIEALLPKDKNVSLAMRAEGYLNTDDRDPSFDKLSAETITVMQDNTGSDTPMSDKQPKRSLSLSGDTICSHSLLRRVCELRACVWTRTNKKLCIIVLCSLLLVCAAALFMWMNIFRFNDANDIQGEWQLKDGTMVLVIDASTIHMPDDLNYAYTINTAEKRISFSFSGHEGSGFYEFSHNRKVLTIIEGTGEHKTNLTLIRVGSKTDSAPYFSSSAISITDIDTQSTTDSTNRTSSDGDTDSAAQDGSASATHSSDASKDLTTNSESSQTDNESQKDARISGTGNDEIVAAPESLSDVASNAVLPPSSSQ